MQLKTNGAAAQVLDADPQPVDQRLAQLLRLEAMTEFAGGIAHDFNNALTVIIANVAAVKNQLDAGEQRDSLMAALTAAHNASLLAKKLMRMGRPDPVTHEIARLEALVERAIAMVRYGCIERGIEIIANVPRTITVCGAPGELHQVLLNLMFNARDAMVAGGTLTICAKTVEVDTGRFVQIDVSDTGSGMDADTAARAFEPFFTTKPPGQGNGLGLAMIHSIMRAHGGTIELHETSSSGTTFRLLLPTGFPSP